MSPYVRLRVSRNESLPPPKGFCPLLFQKALEMIGIRICLLRKWLLDFLTFERVKGDIRKKNPAHWFRGGGGGEAGKEITGEYNIIRWKKILIMAYNAEENLTPLYVWENIPNSRGLGKRSYTNYKITHTPNKSQMVDPLELKKSW